MRSYGVSGCPPSETIAATCSRSFRHSSTCCTSTMFETGAAGTAGAAGCAFTDLPFNELTTIDILLSASASRAARRPSAAGNAFGFDRDIYAPDRAADPYSHRRKRGPRGRGAEYGALT